MGWLLVPEIAMYSLPTGRNSYMQFETFIILRPLFNNLGALKQLISLMPEFKDKLIETVQGPLVQGFFSICPELNRHLRSRYVVRAFNGILGVLSKLIGSAELVELLKGLPVFETLEKISLKWRQKIFFRGQLPLMLRMFGVDTTVFDITGGYKQKREKVAERDEQRRQRREKRKAKRKRDEEKKGTTGVEKPKYRVKSNVGKAGLAPSKHKKLIDGLDGKTRKKIKLAAKFGLPQKRKLKETV